MDTASPVIKGIHIRTFNYCVIFSACLLYGIIIYKTINISIEYNALIVSSQNYIACEKNAAAIREGSDYLTEQVRLYVVNFDAAYAKNYFAEVNGTRRRDNALRDVKRYALSDNITTAFHAALEGSNKLMDKEIYAMKLIATATHCTDSTLPQEIQQAVLTPHDKSLAPEAQMRLARELVFGVDYQYAKASIMQYLAQSLAGIIVTTQDGHINSTTALKESLRQQYICIGILFIMNIIMFIFISLLIVKPLGMCINRIKSGKPLTIAGSYEFKYLAATYNAIFTINKTNEAMLRKRAEYDALTDVLNRGSFDACCTRLCGSDKPLALALVDVDHFKQINDTYGHHIGDSVLQKVARLLSGYFRKEDKTARIGGDEFAVLLEDTTPELLPFIHQRVAAINQALRQPEDGLPPTSISVGVAFSAGGYDSTLYKNADTALYEVKKRHGCGCHPAPCTAPLPGVLCPHPSDLSA